MAVVLLNAVVAFVQERQAERAVDALRRYLPPQATVLRDGRRQVIDARAIVSGDMLVVAEGDRISADARLVSGGVEVDLSALTGESVPVLRAADLLDDHVSPLQARDLVFSGTVCTGGEAMALVHATGMRTELGRIATLSQRTRREPSPLEREVTRVAWLVAVVAVGAGFVFLVLGMLAAQLPLGDAVEFAIGLLVANVPEGLLPTITLALAVGVRSLSRRGALVKRLSAGGEAERVVAIARYHREPGAPEGEVGVAVADAWHGRGVGTGLIERLRERAAAQGLVRERVVR